MQGIMRKLEILALLVTLAGSAAAEPVRPVARIEGRPPAVWDGRAGADRWTHAVMSGLRGPALTLVRAVPRDIAGWCPGYGAAGPGARQAFWLAFVGLLARHESGLDPHAQGGGGRWIGLMQISPATAAWRGCAAASPAALADGGENLACALRIMARAVARDGVIGGADAKGAAADWGPLRQQATRTAMMARTRALPACRAGAQIRPRARPVDVPAGRTSG